MQAAPTGESYLQVGSWFADRKQFNCAAEAFASASRLQPDSGSTSYLWGLSLYSANRFDEAIAPLRRAAQLAPGDLRPRLVLGEALERTKKVPEAVNEWRAALAIDPGSAAALDHLSQDLMVEKDYRSVVALLDSPAAAGPVATNRAESPTQQLNLGVALAGMGRFDDAAQALRKGLGAHPDSMPIADELATVLMFLAHVEDAYGVLDHALARHPDDLPTQLLYLRILVARNSDRAPALGQRLLAAYPGQWEVLYLNGLLESKEGNFRPARTHLDRSLALHPSDDEAHAALGNVLAQLGNLPGAQRNLEQAIAFGDKQPEVEFDLARVLQRLGKGPQAQEKLALYQQMKKEETARTQAAGQVESGDQAMAAGDAARAASLYREAAGGGGADEALVLYKLAMALDKTKDTAGEKAALERAASLSPDLAEAQNQLGYLAMHGGDAARAEGCFRAAVKASPAYVVAWVNLAAALIAEGKWPEAKQVLAQVQTLDPGNATARQLSQAIAGDVPH
jgi:tetratricopeptide (TPR) repeat protein